MSKCPNCVVVGRKDARLILRWTAGCNLEGMRAPGRGCRNADECRRDYAAGGGLYHTTWLAVYRVLEVSHYVRDSCKYMQTLNVRMLSADAATH